jgi:putative ABC transport system permease protein
MSPANFADLRAMSTAFAGVAAAEPYSRVVTGAEGDDRVGNWNVTSDFFSVLDAKPIVGRLFEPADFLVDQTRSPTTVVITYASWKKRFGEDPSIVGRRVEIDHQPARIIGVLPADFSYLDQPRYEMFTPKVLDEQERALRTSTFYNVVARLRPGVSLEQGSADAGRVASRLAQDFPTTNKRTEIELVSLREGIVGNTSRILFVLLGAVAFVLLIACTNVANLMLTRTTRRAREFAVRAALGAGKARLTRQVLTESFVVAAAGGVSGVLVAYWAVGAIRAIGPSSLPRLAQTQVDFRVMTFAFVIVVVTTLLFGLVPAVRAGTVSSRDELRSGRTSGSRRQQRMRAALVAAEVALAVTLLVGAGLLVRSFRQVLREERGYVPDRVLSATVFVWQWNRTPGARRHFIAALVERVGRVPGVVAAGAMSSLPLGRAIGADHASFSIVGHPVATSQQPREYMVAVTPGAFDALRMRPRRGRLFTAHDDSAAAPVILVNESFARRYLANEEPIGKRISVGYYGAPIEREIVGIVGDIRQEALDAAPDPMMYLPHAQAPTGAMAIVLRTGLDPLAISRDVKLAIAEMNPQLTPEIQTLESLIDASLKPRRFTLVLFAAFSTAALVLAIIGVYGVISHATTERSREFGVRIALGAQPGDIMRMVMGQGIAAAGAGVVVGMLGSAVLTRLLANMLFAVQPLDAVTFGSVAALMLGTALAATYVPARKATRVDPLISLRAN